SSGQIGMTQDHDYRTRRGQNGMPVAQGIIRRGFARPLRASGSTPSLPRPPCPLSAIPLSSLDELSEFLTSVERRAFKRTAFAVRDEDAALDIVQDAMIRLCTNYAEKPHNEWPMLFQRIL